MVKVPASVQKEVELIFKGKRRNKKEQSPINREELVQKALAVVELFNEIAQTDPVRRYLSLMDIKVFDDNSWNIVLSGPGAISGCYSRLDIDDYPKRISAYVQMRDRNPFEFWSTDRLNRFSQLTEKQIWKIILEWIQHHRERI